MATPNQLSMASLHIRPAGPTDIPFVLAQIPRLAAFGPPAWRDPVQMTYVDTLELTRVLQQPVLGEHVWIAETTRPVGLLQVSVNTDYYQQAHAYINNLLVAEEA